MNFHFPNKLNHLIFSLTCACFMLLGQLAIAAPKSAAELSGADIMPDFTTAYVELKNPAKLLDTVKAHPIYKAIENTEAFKEAMKERDLQKMQLVANVVAAQLGMNLETTFKELSGAGIHVGFDMDTQIWVVATKANNAEKLREITDTLLDLIELDGLNRKQSHLNHYQYRGMDVYSGQFNQAYAYVNGPWLVASNRKDGIQKVIDLMHDQPKETLSQNPAFKIASTKVSSHKDSIGLAYARMDVLRNAGALKKFAEGKAEHPMHELLIGVLHESFKHANQMAAGIHLNQKELGFSIATPFDHKKLSKGRDYTFNAKGGGAAAPIVTKDTIFAMSTYRDLASFWNNAEALFGENIAADMSQKDSELSTLFGGQSFSSETLPSIKPEIQFVAAQYQAAKGQPEPAIKLPAFALVGELKSKQQRQRFQIAFQSLISFLNIQAGQQGRPAMMLNNQTVGDDSYMTGSYMSMGMKDMKNTKGTKSGAPIHYNFSPTLALTGNKVIISSTSTYAKSLVSAVKSGKALPQKDNTIIKLDGKNTHQILKANFDHLVAQQILEEGKTESQARQDLGIFLKMTEMIKDAELKFTDRDKTALLTLNVHFNQ